MTRLRLASLVLAATSLTACAEIVDTWGPSTRIQTEPAVARCNFDGTGLQRVVVTPIRVVLPKAASPVTISCSAQGYHSSKHVLVTTIDNSVAANLLFGSSIGMAVDIMSGAAEQYPSRILIHLEPQTFPNIATRDKWFGRFRHALEGKWNGIVENLRITCEDELETPLTCRGALAQARTDRGVALKTLDRRRARAEIRAESQARTPAKQS